MRYTATFTPKRESFLLVIFSLRDFAASKPVASSKMNMHSIAANARGVMPNSLSAIALNIPISIIGNEASNFNEGNKLLINSDVEL